MKKYAKYFALVILFSLLILSINGCKSNKEPTASISASSRTGEAPLSVTFDAGNSEDQDGIIDEFEWEFGDGNTDRGRTVKHTFENPGEYTVTLTVTDNDNGTATATDTISVEKSEPSASLNADSEEGEAPLTVTFDLSDSSDPDGTIEEYTLQFGDDADTSGTDLLTEIEHTYEEPGKYSATLEVVDNDDLTGTDSLTINVQETQSENESPSAKMSATPETGTAPLTVEFSAEESSDPDGEIESYEWEFGDGTTGRGPVVNHRYEQAGNYNIRLSVIDDRDGTGSTEKTITIDPAIYYLGESASNGSVRITFTDLRTTESIDNEQADSGKQFVIAKFTVRALEDNQYPSKSLHFTLEESNGRTQPVSLATSTLEEYLPSKILNEGDMARGEIAFQARKSSDYYNLIYDAPNQAPIMFQVEN
ncbi:MAG: PKD domain-containing protein [Candidatus Bipolaricaulota bacterium]